MTIASYTETLNAAQQLPLPKQLRLAEILIRNFYSKAQRESGDATENALFPLTGMTRMELEALSKAVVSPDYQQKLQMLLKKNRSDNLSAAEQAKLDAFLAEIDRVALLKARAQYTLKLWNESGRKE